MQDLKHSLAFKIGSIFLLVGLLMIPTSMVRDLISERSIIHNSVIHEVGDKWGEGQKVVAPFLSIPYDKLVKKTDEEGKEKIIKYREYIHFLPDDLIINGTLEPEKRNRGIYEVVVYKSDLKIEVSFDKLAWESFDIDRSLIHFDKAIVNLGVSDLKGIERIKSFTWNGKPLEVQSGLVNNDVIDFGVHVPIHIEDVNENHSISIELDLRGSKHLYFVPTGKTSNVVLNSTWVDPSFTGQFLPNMREVSNEGFSAEWNVLHLNRNFPQNWKGAKFNIDDSDFGLDLLLPVAHYQKTMRTAKYAILFIGLTFLIFFFVEVRQKVFIHPIQYILVGVALILFYTLLLSFSEHMHFNLAYLISSILTIGLISFYIKGVLKITKVSTLITSILAVIYGLIFVIIQQQDYALLIGSIGLFSTLALVMYFSKQINWYTLELSGETGEKS